MILDNKYISDMWGEGFMDPAKLRGDEIVKNAIETGDIDKAFLRSANGLAFYSCFTKPEEALSPISFAANFNPYLKNDSSYFSSLDSLISCVEKNASADLTEAQQN